MKILNIILKSIKEQYRNFWMLLLTVSCAPLFVAVYYLIDQSEQKSYEIILLSESKNETPAFFSFAEDFLKSDTSGLKFTLYQVHERDEAEDRLKNKKADMLIIFSPAFDSMAAALKKNPYGPKPGIEFAGDLSSADYMIAAIWMGELIKKYIYELAAISDPVSFSETGIGISGSASYFELAIPGLIIFAIIMLMFTATIAVVSETEKKTLQRLQLSRITTAELIGGISFVQVLVGILAAALALLTAMLFGFEVNGSFGLLLFITVLCSISIIAFSMILAGFTRTITQVLVVGNFPLFLFMFFSGAMFPIHTNPWFSIAGYDISVNSLLSPVHAISALNKVMIMQQNIRSIIPEIIAIITLSAIYFITGWWLFYNRQMKKP